MSNKNLLNESQIRQFMKLASLEPLTPGFVEGLTEKQGAVDKEDEHLGAKDGPERDKKQSEKDRRKEMRGEDRAEGENPAAVEERQKYGGNKGDESESDRDYVEESHGRGKREGDAGYGHPDNNSRMEEQAPPEEELEFAADDLEGGSPEEDEEAAVDMEVAADEEGLGDDGSGSRTVSIDDFLAALESTLEDFLDDEVEVDASELEDDEDAAPDEEDEFAPEGDEVVADVEVEEEPLQEGGWATHSADGPANTHQGSKQHPDHRNKKNSKGGLASQGSGLVKEEDDEELEEGVFGGADYEKMAKGKKGSYAPDPEAGERDHTPSPEDIARAKKDKSGSTARDRMASRRGRHSGGGGMKIGGITAEGQDELVEAITKRVAARILKSALTKK